MSDTYEATRKLANLVRSIKLSKILLDMGAKQDNADKNKCEPAILKRNIMCTK